MVIGWLVFSINIANIGRKISANNRQHQMISGRFCIVNIILGSSKPVCCRYIVIRWFLKPCSELYALSLSFNMTDLHPNSSRSRQAPLSVYMYACTCVRMYVCVHHYTSKTIHVIHSLPCWICLFKNNNRKIRARESRVYGKGKKKFKKVIKVGNFLPHPEG